MWPYVSKAKGKKEHPARDTMASYLSALWFRASVAAVPLTSSAAAEVKRDEETGSTTVYRVFCACVDKDVRAKFGVEVRRLQLTCDAEQAEATPCSVVDVRVARSEGDAFSLRAVHQVVCVVKRRPIAGGLEEAANRNGNALRQRTPKG